MACPQPLAKCVWVVRVGRLSLLGGGQSGRIPYVYGLGPGVEGAARPRILLSPSPRATASSSLPSPVCADVPQSQRLGTFESCSATHAWRGV